jgi:hypothetical protein
MNSIDFSLNIGDKQLTCRVEKDFTIYNDFIKNYTPTVENDYILKKYINLQHFSDLFYSVGLLVEFGTIGNIRNGNITFDELQPFIDYLKDIENNKDVKLYDLIAAN